jgi:NADPH:quinone reductase-like Zn-dependent oxidoreductase
MRALVHDRFGEPGEVLSIKDVPKPTPGPGQVLVRMLASPINPSDLMMVRGIYSYSPQLPVTPGFEGVGVVEESGGGLIGWFQKGKARRGRQPERRLLGRVCRHPGQAGSTDSRQSFRRTGGVGVRQSDDRVRHDAASSQGTAS